MVFVVVQFMRVERPLLPLLLLPLPLLGRTMHVHAFEHFSCAPVEVPVDVTMHALQSCARASVVHRAVEFAHASG